MKRIITVLSIATAAIVAVAINAASSSEAPLGTVLRAENIAASQTITQAGAQVYSLAGPGLIGFGSNVSLNPCGTAGNVPTWNGTTWTCATPSGGGGGSVTTTDPLFGTTSLTWIPTLGNLQGTGSAGNALRTNITPTNCGAGSDVNSIAATGIGACTAVVDSVTAVAANGMTCSTTAGAAACNAGSASGCPANDIEQDTGGGSAGWTCQTVVNSISASAGNGVVGSASTGSVSLTLQGTTGACSSAQILEDVAGGATDWHCVNIPTGTVTSGTLTPNTIPKADTASDIVNSSETDNGTTFAAGPAFAVTLSSGSLAAGSTVTASSRMEANGTGFNGTGYYFGDSTNSVVTGHINATGFSLGTTQFRNLEIDDGKGAAVCTMTGSSKQTQFAGAVDVTGALTQNTVQVDNGTGTTNSLPKFTNGAGGVLGNSSITDDGTTTTFGATATTIADATGVFVGASRIDAFNGATGLDNASLDYQLNTNAAATGSVNAVGFNLGTTQFRSFDVKDGKGNSICLFTGQASPDINCHTNTLESGAHAVTGAITATTSIGATTSMSAGTSMLVGTSLGVGANITTTGGHIGGSGTTPVISACGASPVLATNSTDDFGTITMGAATTTSCTLTFSGTFTNNAQCICGNSGSASTETLIGCPATATAMTITAVAASSPGIFTYHCFGTHT